MDRPRMFDAQCEGKLIWERFPTEKDWLDRWDNVKQYLLWLATEG